MAVIGVGAANVDVHGQSKKPLILRDSNPGYMHSSAGGVTRNILENAVLLGVESKLIAALGDDVYADLILRKCAAAGIDTAHCLRLANTVSSTYISILDDSGDMYIALSDMSITANLTRPFLESNAALLQKADVIVCDGCLPQDSIRALVEIAGERVPVFLDPVSTAYARSARDVVAGLDTIKPNRMELEVLADLPVTDEASMIAASQKLIEKGVRRVITTLGDRGCFYVDRDGTALYRMLKPVESMVNATGAGDAFTGALVYSYLQKLAVPETLDCALAAGIIALRGDETINPAMSVAAIKTTLKESRL